MKNKIPSGPEGQSKLHNIDFFRAIAAFAILVWHYQHFYYGSAMKPAYPGSRQPFYDQLTWLYTHGGYGVQFFWLLSGFVFFHVYQTKRDVGAFRFFVNRFSRLYPLHFITLNLVLLLQLISWYLLGEYQVYPLNDVKHYFLNLFMASQWGFQDGWSFNAPIWSVSIEILVYVIFFAYLRTFRVSLLTSISWLLWSFLFFSMSSRSFGSIFACSLLFSMGGALYARVVFESEA